MIHPDSSSLPIASSHDDAAGGPFVPMTIEEYAALQSTLGEVVIRMGNCFWRQVRPMFYRPLLPFQEIAVPHPTTPWPSRLGGVQYVVPDRARSNSEMRFILSEGAEKYCLDSLDSDHRRQVRSASKRFGISTLTDVGEFIEKAHPVYLEFYERTGYAYKSERRDKAQFAAWASVIFGSDKIRVLGVSEGSELQGVSISQGVEDTVLFATLFATSEAVKRQASSLLLHSVRQVAATTPGVRQIFSGMFNAGKGSGDFYLQRGFKVVSKPAVLQANPLTLGLCRIVLPKQYGQLLGKEE
ncbi:MAG TPA: hypothetical protein VK633_12690 [Verrucomicrobiae bacterium]|nr:hypothetical protein [Verrucomicrobiae bacterium]